MARPRPKPGNAGRYEANRLAVVELHNKGLSDQQIAKKLDLTIKYVGDLRRKSGLFYLQNFRHSQQNDLLCALIWRHLFGYTPAAVDWNPAAASAKGQEKSAARFEKFRLAFGCPGTTSIVKRYGSWSAFIAFSGLPPAPVGGIPQYRWRVEDPEY